MPKQVRWLLVDAGTKELTFIGQLADRLVTVDTNALGAIVDLGAFRSRAVSSLAAAVAAAAGGWRQARAIDRAALRTRLPLQCRHPNPRPLLLPLAAVLLLLLLVLVSLVAAGAWYYVYMGMLAVFSTNTINIYAGINGLEAGQSLIIGIAILTANVYELSLGAGMASPHLFSAMLALPFIATTLGE